MLLTLLQTLRQFQVAGTRAVRFLFTPDFSQVIFRRQQIGNRLNGFPKILAQTSTWLKPGENEMRKAGLRCYQLLSLNRLTHTKKTSSWQFNVISWIILVKLRKTRNPKPETRNPKPETRNPKPET
jgi:hypothetical protein